MLIVLSDLHLMDGSAGHHHLEARAFREAMDDLAETARRAKAQDVTIVLLGDIFDLIRTEMWFHVPEDLRPWGANPSEQAAQSVFEAVVDRNKETFEILSGDLVENFRFPVQPKIVYIPGNHDRLCNLYPSLRKRSREVLGLPPSDEPFDTTYVDVDHGVIARHGQEWDAFNFEGSEAFKLREYVQVPLEDYLRVPIGDLIACEIASRIPGVVRDNLGEDHPNREILYRRFQDLFDVRPLMSVIQWLGYQTAGHDEKVQKAIDQSVRDVGDSFSKIPFVDSWIDRHDTIRNPFDEGDVMQMLIFLMETIRFSRFDRSLDRIDKAERAQEERYAAKAAEDFARLDADPDLRDGILFAIYGHTHRPDQQAIGVVGSPPNERYRMYLNTGTWRPVHRQGVTREGFINWMNITYTAILKPGEVNWGGRTNRYPTFETWTGALKDL